MLFDEFSGQLKDKVSEALETKQVLIVHVPGKCTDRLQPLDLSVNKPAKDFLRRKFSSWYATQVQQQLSAGKNAAEVQVDSLPYDK